MKTLVYSIVIKGLSYFLANFHMCKSLLLKRSLTITLGAFAKSIHAILSFNISEWHIFNLTLEKS